MNLDKTIKKQLNEAKEVKSKLLQESKIINLRFNMIVESSNLKNKKGRDEVLVNLLSEMIYLNMQGFNDKVIAENASSVFNILGNLFGGTTNNVITQFRQKGVKYILEQLGISEKSSLREYMVTALENTDLKDVPKLFSDCDFLTKKISDSIPESYMKKLQSDNESQSEFTSIVKNTLHDVIKDSDFSSRLEGRISGIVCPLVEKMSSKFGQKLENMKSTLITPNMNNQA
jgi:hypothetical protein